MNTCVSKSSFVIKHCWKIKGSVINPVNGAIFTLDCKGSESTMCDILEESVCLWNWNSSPSIIFRGHKSGAEPVIVRQYDLLLSLLYSVLENHGSEPKGACNCGAIPGCEVLMSSWICLRGKPCPLLSYNGVQDSFNQKIKGKMFLFLKCNPPLLNDFFGAGLSWHIHYLLGWWMGHSLYFQLVTPFLFLFKEEPVWSIPMALPSFISTRHNCLPFPCGHLFVQRLASDMFPGIYHSDLAAKAAAYMEMSPYLWHTMTFTFGICPWHHLGRYIRSVLIYI